MKLLANLCERTVTQIVKIIPQSLINLLISWLPPDLLATLIRSFHKVKIYPVSILGTEFLIESGPRDDHFLDLEKNQMQKWENEVLALWQREVTKGGIVIDVGAYLGVYSILAAKHGAERVIAVEPNSYSFEQLNRNVMLNSVFDSVELHQVAVGASEGIVSMITPRNRPFSSAAQVKNSPTNRKLDSWTHVERVRMVSLDSLLLESVKEVSVIKIDAEGYEQYVLEGAVQILRQSMPSIIIEILALSQKNEIDNFLSHFGYHLGVSIENSDSPTNYFYEVSLVQ